MKKILFLLLIFPSLVFAQTNKKISEMDSVTTLTPAMYWPIIDEGEGVPIDRNKRISYSRLRTTLDSRYFQSSGAAALTKVDDTNVTLTLGGTPATALLQATSLTLGWTGQLGVARGGSGAGTLTGILVGNGTSPFTAITDNSTNWNTAYNDKINSAAFNTGDGVITLTQQDAGTVTVDIDGRYQSLATKLTNFVSSGISIANDDITGTNIELRPTGYLYADVSGGYMSVEGGTAFFNPNLEIQNTSTSDATLTFQVTADAQYWTMGIDNSTGGNPLVISPGTTLDPTASIAWSFYPSTGAMVQSGNHSGNLIVITNNDKTTTNAVMTLGGGQDSGDGVLLRFQDGDATPVGSISFSGGTTSYNTSSDRRLKSNIRDSKLNHRFLYSILKDYEWKEDGKSATGVIAQDLHEHFPMAVHAPDSGMWSVDYGKLTIPLIQSAEDHEKRISRLEAENKVLKKALDRLEARLDALEKADK